MPGPRTLVLDEEHRKFGAKLVEFAGYLMPMRYAGIRDEHAAVRERVGLFDVSHMGEVEFRGPDAVTAVNGLVTNDVSALEVGRALYTAMCDERAGIVDDLILYRLAEDHVMICVNASNRRKDFDHMKRFAGGGEVEIEDTSDSIVQLALQGPLARKMMGEHDPAFSEIEPFQIADVEIAGVRCRAARTGYTGEDGFEFYIPVEGGKEVFHALTTSGEEYGLQMCGLGARDTLRLESKYLLYGNDIDESTNPLEAGLGWVVKWETAFVGRDALQRVRNDGVERRLRGFVLGDRGVMRRGCDVYAGDTQIGSITSGSFSPTLGKSIGLGYVRAEHCALEAVAIDIRGKRIDATMTKKPFYRRS
jgi:aminomethyltransferase